MKSRQFSSFNEAIQYLEERGKLTYFGRIGDHFKICLYNYMCEGILYRLNIYDDGKVEMRE